MKQTGMNKYSSGGNGEYKLPSVPNKMAMGGMKGMPGMPNALPLSKGLESRGAKSKGGKDKFAAYKSNLGAGYG